jgi:outer membrane protein
MLLNRTLYTIFLLAAVPLTSVFAQPSTQPDSTLQAILGQIDGTPLQLRDAVDQSLQSAASVKIAEASLNSAGGSVRRESGMFDPQLFFDLTYLDQKIPTASFFSGAPVLSTQQTLSQSGLRLGLPTGTQIELSVNTTRLATNSSFAFLNPEYDASGVINLRQPLLGGFLASGRKQLSHSEHALDAEQARYDQEIITVSADVERLYWDLYAAERDYAVQRLTRDRAEAFLKETEVRAKTGLAGPDEVANARTFLAEQSLLLIDREEQFDQSSDHLAARIGRRPASGTARFVPATEPSSNYSVDPIDSLVARAFRNNLDLRASQNDVEAAQVLADASHWEALPRVDLVGSIGGTGLAGNPQDVIFNGDTLRITQNGTFGDALSQVQKRDFPNWSIGVEVNIPIGFRSGLGEKDRLEAETEKNRQQYVDKARSLEEQVRSTYRELVHGQDRLAAARAGVDAAQEQVRIGTIEFHNGRSTAFELVRLSEDLAVAQRRYSDALVRTAKAAATLRQLTSGGYPSNSK